MTELESPIGVGCTCEWDEAGNPVGGVHRPVCPLRAWVPKAPWRQRFVRVFKIERWRIYVMFRYYRRLDDPSFKFTFELGKPGPTKWPHYLDYEGDLDA